MHHKFRRVHPMRATPATEAGISDHGARGFVNRQHKNSEASLAAGLAPEFRGTQGDKLVDLDYGLHDLVSRKSTNPLLDLIPSVSD